MAVEMSFGDVLRVLRKRAMLTQEELAERSGLCVRSISNYECGRCGKDGQIRLSTLKRLADALELAGPALEEFKAAALHLPVLVS